MRGFRNGTIAIAIAFLAGCSSATPNEGSVSSSDDAITDAEFAAGATFQDDDEDDPSVVHADRLAPDPAMEKLIDGPAAAAPAPTLDDTEVALAACRAATGYVRGRASSICITTIDGHAVEVHTASAYLAMRAAAAKDGVYIHIVSGFRTMAEQRRLYAAYRNGTGNLAAPPGYSNHQSGHALDLNTSAHGVYAWLAHHGAAHQFRRTVPSEAWHWEHW